MVHDDASPATRPGADADDDGSSAEFAALVLLLAYPLAAISYVKGAPLFEREGFQGRVIEAFLGRIETLAAGPRLTLAVLFALGALAGVLWLRVGAPTWAALAATVSLAAIVLGVLGSFALVSVAGLIAGVIMLGASSSADDVASRP